jgi:UDP-N-acetylmuramoyl-tripeptide--D-alanyl-D-alanine ligase
MKNLTIRNIIKACGADYFGPYEIADREITSVTADSREAKPGCLFIPIKGEKADGHSFISQVMEKGALVTLTEKKTAAKGHPFIYVKSTTDAMRKIAAFYLQSLGTPVVSVTGSVGKTSTKEMIASVLSQKYRTLKTLGNFNNDLGLPFTIFRLTEEDQIAVLEMGISHFGEMSVLASIAPPTTSVITNIGTCHLEFLKDRDGVLKAKTEVFDFLKDGGRAVLNGDDDKLRTVREVKGQKPIFFGMSPDNDVWADEVKPLGLEGISCRIHLNGTTFHVTVPIPGEHMVMNACAAAAVGSLWGETNRQIKKGIESLESLSGRFHILKNGGRTVIDDCYNANPMSMKASLKVLSHADGRKVAILGDMGELGKNEKELHREVGQAASEMPLDLVITAGPLASLIGEEIRKENTAIEVKEFSDADEMAKDLPALLQADDTVLVKASHFMHFEKIVELLTKSV